MQLISRQIGWRWIHFSLIHVPFLKNLMISKMDERKETLENAV